MNIDEVLLENFDKNFVQRIINPKVFPVINNEQGEYMTHLMSSGEFNSKGIAYPEIIQDKNTGELRKLSRKDAYDYAVANKEYIEFSNPEDALWFSKNYKNNSFWLKNQRDLIKNKGFNGR